MKKRKHEDMNGKSSRKKCSLKETGVKKKRKKSAKFTDRKLQYITNDVQIQDLSKYNKKKLSNDKYISQDESLSSYTSNSNQTDDKYSLDTSVELKKNKKKFSRKILNGSEDDDEEKPTIKSQSKHKLNNTRGSLTETEDSDSLAEGRQIISWFVHPIKIEDFFESYWENKPLHIGRNDQNYFSSIMNVDDIKVALEQHNIYYTKNLDVTIYENGIRRTDNPEGRATVTDVFDFYDNKRSVRMLNPQTFIPKVGVLTTSLQDLFGCFVGANTYLTPPDSQGFAPHYDDIEAFILQLEGEKHWKVYEPRSPDEILPKYSSNDFQESELNDPCLEITLRPGDLLYLPRGYIHQGKCVDGKHSLHITISMYQCNTWADLLEKVLAGALQEKMATDVEFRKGLPLNYLSHVGMVHSNKDTRERSLFLDKLQELLVKLIEDVPADSAADQMAKQFMVSAMPPCVKKSEIPHLPLHKSRQDIKCFFNEMKFNRSDLYCAKSLRANIMRLVSEEDNLYVYYCSDNSRVNVTDDEYRFSVTMKEGEWVDTILSNYPKYIKLTDLPGVKTHKTWESNMSTRYSHLQIPSSMAMTHRDRTKYLPRIL